MSHNSIEFVQETDFPYGNTVHFTVNSDKEYTLKIRVPYWCSNFGAKVNGCEYSNIDSDGWLEITKQWNKDNIEITFDMPVMAVKASSKVVADANKIAVQRGPFVYCAEQIDNVIPLSQFRISAKEIQNASVTAEDCQLGTIPFITIETTAEYFAEKGLYTFNPQSEQRKATLKMLPYYAWANRGSNDMTVWLHQK